MPFCPLFSPFSCGASLPLILRSEAIFYMKEVSMKALEFTNLTDENIGRFKKLSSLQAKFRIDSLRHLGEYPLGRRFFKKQFSEMLKTTAHSLNEKEGKQLIVMHSGKTLIGYAAFFYSSADSIIRLPYTYSGISEFYIVSHFRGKGYGKKLNEYVEKAILNYGTPLILLMADPVTGFAFWNKMGYADTELNKATGVPLIYFKCLQNEIAEKQEEAFITKRSSTALIPVNPYNKRLIKTLEPMWISYWQTALKNGGKKAEKKRKIKKRLKSRLEFARKTPQYRFAAFYHDGTVKGFAQYGVEKKIDKLVTENCGYIYEFAIAEKFRRNGFGKAMSEHIEAYFTNLGVTAAMLAPDPVFGLPFWKALGYKDTGIECEKGENYYMKQLPKCVCPNEQDEKK